MQRIFATLAFLIFLGLTGPAVARAKAPARPAAAPAQPTDTVVIRLPNQAVLMLLVRDAAQLRELKKYQLDSLTSRLAGYITQAENAAKSATSDKVTMEFYPDKDRPGQNLPEQIRVTTSKKAASSKVDVALSRFFNINVTRDADGDKEFDIKANAKRKPKTAQSAADSVRHLYGRDRHLILLRWDGGLTTLVNRGTNATGSVPDLATWGSRYFNVGLNYVQPLLYRKGSRLALTFGPEVSFNWLQLKGNDVWTERDGRTGTETAPAALQIDKSQLYYSTLNLPVMVEFKLLDRREHRTLTLGVGGFGGYRLGGSTKLQYKTAGSDYDHEDVLSGGFHLNNWQYGLQGEIGFSVLRVVVKYNLNEVFRENQGPKAQALSVGLKIIGF